ncbi:hypothetical protein LZG00_08105 [Rhodobacteraceae bacterium LMO-12]|nr:hypothetical protein [Rhodobacteraceae bacterium LMO-JJ12]
METLQPYLRTTGSVQEYGFGNEPLVTNQIGLFKLIHYPFANLEPLSAQYHHPVDVIVIDSAVTKWHCDLPPLMLSDGNVLGPSEEAEEAEEADGATHAEVTLASVTGMSSALVYCSEIDPLALSQSEHGAAVAGVIASPQNGKGMVGINPYARLHMISFDMTLSRAAKLYVFSELETEFEIPLADIPETGYWTGLSPNGQATIALYSADLLAEDTTVIISNLSVQQDEVLLYSVHGENQLWPIACPGGQRRCRRLPVRLRFCRSSMPACHEPVPGF